MKLLRPLKSLILVGLVVYGCTRPEENVDQSLITVNDLNIKKVSTYYIDEYGDQKDRDGDLVGYAVFGNDGTLLNIKTTNSKQTMFQSNAWWINRYSGVPVNRLLWVLDGGAYGQRWRNVNPFLTRGLTYPKELARLQAERVYEAKQQYDRNNEKYGGQQWDYSYQIDNPDQPRLIQTSSKQPMTGDHSEMTSTKTQKFQYDAEGRVTHMEVSQSHSIEGWPAQNYSESYEYDGVGRLSNYQRGNLDVKISRNDLGNIYRVDVTRENQPLRWYTFEYLDNGLRQSSQAFNGSGALEFSVEYVYEFYE